MSLSTDSSNLGIKEVASIAGASVITVRRWLTSGLLIGEKVGDRGEWMVSSQSLEKFLASGERRYADALQRWKAGDAAVVTPRASTATTAPEQAPDHLGAVIEALRAELAAKNQQIADLADAIKRQDEIIMRMDERQDQLVKMLPAPVSSDQAEQKAPASWWARIFGRKS